MAQNEMTTTDAASDQSVLERILGTSDHKTIGRMWILSGAALLVIGMAISLVAAVEQISVGGFSIASDGDELVQIWSAGRTLTFMGGLVAILVGLWYGVGGGLFAAILVAGALWFLQDPISRLAQLYESAFELRGLGIMGGLNLIIRGGLLGLSGAWLAVARHISRIGPR